MSPTPTAAALLTELLVTTPVWALGIVLGLAVVGIIRLRIWLLQRVDRVAAERSMQDPEDPNPDDPTANTGTQGK